MALKRETTKTKVNGKRRVYRVVKVTRMVTQVEKPYVRLGEAMREARFALGLTQEEVATRLGMSRTSLTNIEIGRQRVLLADVFVFAKALKVTARSLFEVIQQL